MNGWPPLTKTVSGPGLLTLTNAAACPSARPATNGRPCLIESERPSLASTATMRGASVLPLPGPTKMPNSVDDLPAVRFFGVDRHARRAHAARLQHGSLARADRVRRNACAQLQPSLERLELRASVVCRSSETLPTLHARNHSPALRNLLLVSSAQLDFGLDSNGSFLRLRSD